MQVRILMNWTDDAFILSVRRHGESSAVVHLLTCGHGRHAGLVRGGAGKGMRGVLQAGNRVAARWQARLDEHLGYLTCEAVAAHAAQVMADAGRLAALAAACALADSLLPEREPHPGMFAALEALIGDLEAEASSWPASYVCWELVLLAELGYGLDLSSCAVTGTTEDLAWVSPKSARAVSTAAGAPYADKLLPLPRFLLEGGGGTAEEVTKGLALTGHFLERHVLAPQGTAMPAARIRLVDRLRGAVSS